MQEWHYAALFMKTNISLLKLPSDMTDCVASEYGDEVQHIYFFTNVNAGEYFDI